jgi:hypothetical protein
MQPQEGRAACQAFSQRVLLRQLSRLQHRRRLLQLQQLLQRLHLASELSLVGSSQSRGGWALAAGAGYPWELALLLARLLLLLQLLRRQQLQAGSGAL